MVTIYFTKEITEGTLKGFRFNESLAFADVSQCADYVAKGKKGFKTKFGPSWKIVEASFQSYAR